MRILKFALLWIVLAVVMTVSWSLGITMGNAITQSSPPPVADTASVASSFFAVCLVNSLLLSLLIWKTRSLEGAVKWRSMVLYVWIIQFALMQMESFYFIESVAMSVAQIGSVVIGGAVMSLVTVSVGILIAAKMDKADARQPFAMSVTRQKPLWMPLFLLTAFVYPWIYLLFGYFIAWQSEPVRMYYTHSAEMEPLWSQIPGFLTDGLYGFQILRGVIWVIVSLPVIVMLYRERFTQYVLMGVLSALPAIQLFIPNPFMPSEVAMAHFVETSTSNFLWGMVMVFFVNRAIQKGAIVVRTRDSKAADSQILI